MMQRRLTPKEKIMILRQLHVMGLNLKMVNHTGYKRVRTTRNSLF